MVRSLRLVDAGWSVTGRSRSGRAMNWDDVADVPRRCAERQILAASRRLGVNHATCRGASPPSRPRSRTGSSSAAPMAAN